MKNTNLKFNYVGEEVRPQADLGCGWSDVGVDLI